MPLIDLQDTECVYMRRRGPQIDKEMNTKQTNDKETKQKKSPTNTVKHVQPTKFELN